MQQRLYRLHNLQPPQAARGRGPDVAGAVLGHLCRLRTAPEQDERDPDEHERDRGADGHAARVDRRAETAEVERRAGSEEVIRQRQRPDRGGSERTARSQPAAWHAQQEQRVGEQEQPDRRVCGHRGVGGTDGRLHHDVDGPPREDREGDDAHGNCSGPLETDAHGLLIGSARAPR